MQLKQLKQHALIYLKDLKLFTSQCYEIDDKFIELMYETIEEISGCIDKKLDAPPQRSENQAFDIDEKRFRHFHSIQCISCGVSCWLIFVTSKLTSDPRSIQ